MMGAMEYKSYIGSVALVMGIVSYCFYIFNILKGKTKPHALSWLVWGVLNSFIFFEQTKGNAGAGSWVTLLSAVVAFVIFALSLRYGEKVIAKLDWYCIFGAAGSLTLWQVLQSDNAAVLLASLTFVLGFIPTYRKGYKNPDQEASLTFALNGTKFLVALFALNSISFLSAFYPTTLVVMNWGFVLLLLARRLQLRPVARRR